MSSSTKSSTSQTPSNSLPESKYACTVSSPGSSRPQPPLPPTPPPYSVNPSTIQPFKTSASQSLVYNQFSAGSTEFMQTSGAPSNDTRLNNPSASGAMLSSYPPLMPPMIFNRPSSIPISSLYGSSSSQGDNPSGGSQNLPMALSSIHSIQSISHLQPLQPPQLPRPPQHLRPPVPTSSQTEQGVPLLQSPVQLQLQQLQMVQPPQVSPARVYYPAMQQENLQHTFQLQRVENTQPQVQNQQRHGTLQPSDDIGMSLQHYFSSPEAIQVCISYIFNNL